MDQQVDLFPLFQQCPEFKDYVTHLETLQNLQAQMGPIQRQIAVVNDQIQTLLQKMKPQVEQLLQQQQKIQQAIEDQKTPCVNSSNS